MKAALNPPSLTPSNSSVGVQVGVEIVVEDELVEELVEEDDEEEVEEETRGSVDSGSTSDITHEHAELTADGTTLQCETNVGRLVVWVTTAVV